MKTERRYDIDWLRVIAIWLLLIYHIAIIFQPWAMFVGFIRSEELMQELWTYMSLINVWRIPLLFCVSGMGVYFAIQKRDWRPLVLERSQRILFPFIVGFIAVTPIHMLIFQYYYGMPVYYFPHAGHLWFLGNIFCYVLLMSPVFFYLKRHEDRFKAALSSFLGNPFGLMVVILFFVMEALILKPQIYELYAGTWHGFYLGLLAFFFGFLFVYTGNAFWHTVLKWRWTFLGLAAALYTIRLFMFALSAPGYLAAVESNMWLFAIFGFAFRYLNRPSSALSYLSQAAYPVYIVHMFVLYAGASIILPLDVPVMIKLISIVLFTIAGCYLIYEFAIRRVNVLRPVFGLKLNQNRGAKANRYAGASLKSLPSVLKARYRTQRESRK